MLLSLLLPLGVKAQTSGYEERLISWGLSQVGRELEPSPGGKRIEEVLVASEEIVAATDPYPGLLNAIHFKTRDEVIRRELLLGVGEEWSPEKAAETERNLRRLGVLAIAKVVPVKGRAPDTVALLAVTKDLWSIRLNSSFNLVGGLLQYLRIRPTEQNFLGLNKQLSLDFVLKLDAIQVGQSYSDPRLWGTRLQLTETFALIFNRETGRPEGSRGSLAFGLPLFSLETEHGFSVSAGWLVQRSRIYRGASVWQLPYPDATGPTGTVPYVYDVRDITGGATYTRSFGRKFKTNVTAGFGGYTRRYAPPPEAELSSEQRDWLVARYLPRSEDALYLTTSVRAFEATYKVMRNIGTFALSEDFQLGYSLLLHARWADPIFLSPQRFVEVGASARYRWYFADDLLTVTAAGAARYMPLGTGTAVAGPWVNKRVAFELNNISPVLGVGRLVLRALVDLKQDDLDNRVVLLGGGNGLRGVAPEALSGNNLLLFNLEYRTRPIELFTLHAGLVAFYDAGSAFDRGPAVVHTVGLGLRLLFPQFDVEPVRIDFGYVINAASPNFPDRFSASFGQVDDYRPTFLDRPLE